jgi:membrane associated rhomboid family serine protease
MNRGGGGGMSMALPPFTHIVKKLLIINTAVFMLTLLADNFSPFLQSVLRFGWLVPSEVLHGALWQLVTYSFFHVGPFHLLFNMLALWMFGSQFEMDWGPRQFLEFYFFCVIGAALSTMVVGYAGLAISGGPGFGFFANLAHLVYTRTGGASGGIYGLLIAFGMLYGDRQIFMFPFPFSIRAKYMVGIWILLSIFGVFGAGGVANFAHLGGAFCGWLYLRFVPRRGLQVQVKASEGFYGIRNSYYRWKRRRAARKFEVYMRKQDRSQYFDEHGNFKDPHNNDKNDSGGPRSPWVN